MNKLLLALCLTSCATLPTSLDTSKVYKRTINIDKCVGVCVFQKQGQYNFKITLPKKTKNVRVTSCHRDLYFIDQEPDMRFSYAPNRIEASGYCPLEIFAASDKSIYAWGLIDFVDDEKLPASVYCNGEYKVFDGVSVCQGKVGLEQMIVFAEPAKVLVDEESGCIATPDGSNKIFKIELAHDKCLFVFYNKTGRHRLLTFGYDEAYYE